MDERIKEVQKNQQQIDDRTKVENEAIKLIEQCKFEEAIELLKKIERI